MPHVSRYISLSTDILFYGPINTVNVVSSRSVNLLFLSRFSRLSNKRVHVHITVIALREAKTNTSELHHEFELEVLRPSQHCQRHPEPDSQPTHTFPGQI